MKHIFALIPFIAICHAKSSIYFPDEWEKIKIDALRGVPMYEPPYKYATENFIKPQRSSHEKLKLYSFFPPQWEEQTFGLISQAVANFSLNLDRAIEDSKSSNDENIIFSPLALSATLSLVLLASNGETFNELAKILGFETIHDVYHDSELVHKIVGLANQELIERLADDPNGPKARLSLGLFLKSGYLIRDEFLSISKEFYRSDVVNLDFESHSQEAQQVINNWVYEKSDGKIESILDDIPSPLTKAIITSVLYFNGEWDQHFIDGITQKVEFKVEENNTVWVDMMYNDGRFPFYNDPDLKVKIIGFPYKNNQVSMYAILPHEPGAAALKKLKRQLNASDVEELIGKMQNRTCLVALPRMRLSSDLNLEQALQHMGLKSLFDPSSADLGMLSQGNPLGGSDNDHEVRASQYKSPFEQDHCLARPLDPNFVAYLRSNLPDVKLDELRRGADLVNPGLFADSLLHRVRMTINEEGTEAAAATAIEFSDKILPDERFKADRPFLLLIRHAPTKSLMFWATINKPTPFYTQPPPKV